MAILTREEILKVEDLQIAKVDVKEWGGEVWVRGLTGIERDKFEAGIVAYKGKNTQVNMSNIRAKLAAMTVCDEKGNLLFTVVDVSALAKKSAAALDRIFEVAQRLSGIGEEDVKELAEGLEEDPFEDSASD